MGLNYADYPIIFFVLVGIVAATKLVMPFIDDAAQLANAYFGRPRHKVAKANPQAFNVNRHPRLRKAGGR